MVKTFTVYYFAFSAIRIKEIQLRSILTYGHATIRQNRDTLDFGAIRLFHLSRILLQAVCTFGTVLYQVCLMNVTYVASVIKGMLLTEETCVMTRACTWLLHLASF